MQEISLGIGLSIDQTLIMVVILALSVGKKSKTMTLRTTIMVSSVAAPSLIWIVLPTTIPSITSYDAVFVFVSFKSVDLCSNYWILPLLCVGSFVIITSSLCMVTILTTPADYETLTTTVRDSMVLSSNRATGGIMLSNDCKGAMVQSMIVFSTQVFFWFQSGWGSAIHCKKLSTVTISLKYPIRLNRVCWIRWLCLKCLETAF